MATGVLFFDKPEEREILKKHCKKAGVSFQVVQKMVAEEFEAYGKGRRHGIYIALEELLESSFEN